MTTQPMAPRPLWLIEDVCAYLRVSRDFVYDEVRRGRLPASKIGRHLRFRETDMDAYVAEHSVLNGDL